MDAELIKTRFDAIMPHLDERLRRFFAASEALALGHGGIVTVSQATGISRNAIARGMEELTTQPSLSKKIIREKGYGRKRTIDK